MLGRLERVMGTKDEDSRQKAMANLAMIGLAIAAGQSPDALTNIAQGALTGMQAIRQSEAADEAQRREMRMAAMRMAQEEVNLGRRLQSAESVAALRAGEGGAGVRDFRNPIDAYQDATTAAERVQAFEIPEGMTREEYINQVGLDRVRNSYTPEQLVGTTFEGIHGQGGARVGTTVPTRISTRAEFDALPSGATYLDTQTGLIGVKP
jgi:hypothetical protein